MKKWIAILLAAVLLLLPVGCQRQETALTTIRLSEVTHSVFYAPQYVAMSQGFFAEEGLELELLNGGGADKVMTSVLTGEVEIGLAGPEACIYVLLRGGRTPPRSLPSSPGGTAISSWGAPTRTSPGKTSGARPSSAAARAACRR